SLVFFSHTSPSPLSTLFPYTTLFRSAFLPYFPLANGLLTGKYRKGKTFPEGSRGKDAFGPKVFTAENIERAEALIALAESRSHRSEEHTSELQSLRHLVCRLLLEKKK